MKKVLLLILSMLMLGFSTLQLCAMEEREGGKMYKIECTNGVLEIDQETLNNFKEKSIIADLLINVIKDDSCTIPLPMLECDVVKKIFLLIGKMPQEQTSEYKKEFIKELLQEPLDMPTALLNAANYLNMPLLLKLLSKSIAYKIVQEMRSPFSPDEIAEHTFSNSLIPKRVVRWFNQNEHILQKLPLELVNMITIKIIKFISCFIPVSSAHCGSVSCVAWNPYDASQFISGTNEEFNNAILLWQCDPSTNQLISKPLAYHPKRIERLVWCLKGSHFISVGDAILLWHCDPSNNQWNSQVAGYANVIPSPAWSPAGSHFISVGRNNTILLLWQRDPSNNKWSSQELAGHADVITCLAWGHEESQFFSVGADNTILLWQRDPSNDQWHSQELTGHLDVVKYPEMIKYIACISDSQFIAISDNTILLWQRDRSNNQWGFKQLTGHEDMTIRYITCSPDGSQLISVSTDNVLRMWKLDSVNNQLIFQGIIHTGNSNLIKCIAWSPDDLQFISASLDTITLFKKITSYSKTFTLKQALLMLGKSLTVPNISSTVLKKLEEDIQEEIEEDIQEEAEEDTLIPIELQEDFDNLPEELKNFLVI